jgi:hypothetical protein
VGALTPLGKVAKTKRRWLASVAAYTGAGLTTSVFVGCALAFTGGLAIPTSFWPPGLLLALSIAMLGALRELGWLSFSLPQPARQTRDIWAKRFRSAFSAGLWGFDLGLTVITRFTFSGTWFIIVVAFFSGEPLFGGTIFAAHWLARAAPVWIAPALADDARATPRLMARIDSSHRLFQLVHAAGLVSASAILSLLLLTRLS